MTRRALIVLLVVVIGLGFVGFRLTDQVSAALPQYTLTTSVVGSGTVDPVSGTYSKNNIVSVVAIPDPGWRFDHWEGVPEADRLRMTITVSAPAQVMAVFVPRAVIHETLETPFYNRAGELITSITRFEPLWQPLTNEMPAKPARQVFHSPSHYRECHPLAKCA